jgi:DNA-binding LacI/PurR family transcriptional regulator
MGRATRATIRDVAQAAGVSATTVSDALSGKGRLPEETRQRVRDAAARLHYRPSALARSRGSGIVGLVFTPAPAASLSTVWYWAVLANHVTETALEAGFAPLLLPYRVDRLRALPIQPDGLLVVDPTENDAVLAHAREMRVPVVTVGRDVAGPSNAWVDDGNAEGTQRLLDGAVRPEERLVVVTVGPHKSYVHDTVEGVRSWARRTNSRFLTHWLDELDANAIDDLVTAILVDKPEVVLAQNDRVALGLLARFAARGIEIPRELRLLSATDAPELEHARPAVTALRQHPDRVGQLAARALIDLVNGKTIAARHMVPAEPVFRASAPALAPRG